MEVALYNAWLTLCYHIATRWVVTDTDYFNRSDKIILTSFLTAIYLFLIFGLFKNPV